MKKLLYAFILSIAISLLMVTTVLAIAHPDSVIIYQVDAYQGVLETNDQLHLATFEISDSANLSDPANETFLFRLLDDGVEIATATPYAYYNDGYTQGAVSFYFASTDADLPTWATANLSLQLTGNPSLGWDGGVPPSYTANSSAWDSWNTQPLALGTRVRRIALDIQPLWTNIDLIQVVQGINKLTDEGETYFENVITNLRTMSPELFVSIVSQPDIPTEAHTTTYGDAVEARWTILGGGTFDLTDAATLFSTTRTWFTSFLYVGFCFIILFASSYRISISRGGGTSGMVAVGALRPALFLFGALMILGSFMGFLVFEVGLFCGIAGGLAIVLALFWRGSV